MIKNDDSDDHDSGGDDDDNDDDACFSSADVLDSMARFSVQGVFNYSMLTLSDQERVLYVGAREALFALDPNDISKQLRQQVTHSHTDTHPL